MGDSTPRLGIVTVTYNGASVLEDFFKSIRSQTYTHFKLYAIDNNSADASVEALEREREARCIIVKNPANLGVAEANNQGIRMALNDGCSHVLLLNNDTVFPPQLFEQLMAAGAAGHALVTPKIYFHDEPKTLWFAGGRFMPLKGHAIEHLGFGDIDRGQFDVPRNMDYAPTCCLLIAASVFERVGFMDARYFVYFDDADFCLRCMRAGIPVWYAPEMILYHKAGTSTGGAVSPFGARMGVRNKIFFLRKNFGRVRFTVFSSLYFVYLLLRWIAGRDSWPHLRLKIRAFAEGLRLGNAVS